MHNGELFGKKTEISEKGRKRGVEKQTQSKHMLHLSEVIFRNPFTVYMNILIKSRMESEFLFYEMRRKVVVKNASVSSSSKSPHKPNKRMKIKYQSIIKVKENKDAESL